MPGKLNDFNFRIKINRKNVLQCLKDIRFSDITIFDMSKKTHRKGCYKNIWIFLKGRGFILFSLC